MSERKGEPQAGDLGRGLRGEALPLALLDDSQSLVNAPAIVIVPRKDVSCQVRMISETRAILALADDVLERHNIARARYLAGGDPGDFLAMQALADDRRALLAEVGR